MKKSGFAFHCHHDVLFEWVHDYDLRVKIIKESKPPEEQELRLKLLLIVPQDRLPKKLLKARETFNKAWEDYTKARETYNKAWEDYNKVLEAYREDIELLHSELCPNCPWDGKTIFNKECK